MEKLQKLVDKLFTYDIIGKKQEQILYQVQDTINEIVESIGY